jgi:hypothetical protein
MEGLLQMRSRPYRTDNLFDTPVDEGTRGMLLPIGQREDEFSFATPQFLLDAYDAAQIPRNVLRGDYETEDELTDAANQFSLEFGVLPALASSAISPNPNTLMMGYGSILDEIDPKFIERLKLLAEGKYENQPYYSTNLSDLGQTKAYKPFNEMTSEQFQEIDLLPQTKLNPEDLEGSNLIFNVGDRTSTGRRIVNVDGVPLTEGGLLTEGGADYGRGLAQQLDDSVWASGENVINTLEKRIKAFENTGDPTKLFYVAMSPKSDEYSTMLTNVVVRMLPNMTPSNKGIKKLDASIRKQFPDWAGFGSNKNLTIKAEEQLAENGELRKIFLRAVESQKAEGFPDVQSARKSVTDENLLGLPTGAGGYAVSDVTGSPRVLEKFEQKAPHTTYVKAVQGEGGGIIGSGKVPMEIYAPSFLSDRRAINAPMDKDWRSFSMSQKFPTQKATPEYTDRFGEYLYQAGRMGLLD